MEHFFREKPGCDVYECTRCEQSATGQQMVLIRDWLYSVEGVRVTKRDGHGTWNGRAITVNLRGSNADHAVSGAEFMSRMGLMSTWFAKPAVSG